ncbi:cell division protein FtsX [Thermodesulfobacteriota bacterium]
MNFNRLLYFFKKALMNMRHSILINLVTIGTISMAILIFSSFILIVYNLNNIVTRFEDEVHIVSYLKDEFVSEHDAIKAKILEMDAVNKVSYRSKEEALQVFRESLGKSDKFLDNIPKNPLPASFEIRLKKGFEVKSRLKEIDNSLKKMGYFDDSVYGQEWIENFSNLLNMLKIIGTAISGGFLLAAVFIISNTIKLTLFLRKEEIAILKLVGATDAFIRFPFFLEGILQGLLGALFSTILLYFMHLLFLAELRALHFVGINPAQMPFLPLSIIFPIMLFSAMLGMFGSFLSLGELIKE